MKLLTLLALLIPTGVPTPAVARFCVNQVVPNSMVNVAKIQARAEGCSEVRIVKVDEEHTLVFGVKVLMGEATSSF